MNNTSFSEYISSAFEEFWNLNAYSDYPETPMMYNEVAVSIAKLHFLFKNMGVTPGDKIAICSKNCTNWAVVFLAVTTYGAVAVPLLHEFSPETIAGVVEHSDSVMLFVSEKIWSKLDSSKFGRLKSVITIDNFEFALLSGNQPTPEDSVWKEHAESHVMMHFSRQSFLDSIYQYDEGDPLVLNYTSGTTTNPKGVMIPSRAVASNITFAFEVMPSLIPGDKVISILPLAHTYSMSFELLAEFCKGAHVHFLTKPLHVKYVMDSFASIGPKVLIMVPLILEKIVMKGVFPVLQKPAVKRLRSIWGIRSVIDRIICRKLFKSLGGNLYEVIVGGAALNREVDSLLNQIRFPYTVGYGMTECAPIICYEDWKRFKPGTCGKVVNRMTIKVNSQDPESIDGEILVKGDNVMLGYYKNEAETKAVIDADGWLHTGDLGVIDKDGNLVVRGRCKTMILGPSGQNIYPEEIEEKINMFPTVAESLVVERSGKLCALIYPDKQHPQIGAISDQEEMNEYFKNFHKEVNKKLSPYQQLSAVVVMAEEFEKTPKKSIKRYLYG